MPKVFVYGTLLSGEGNNHLLQNADSKLIGEAKVQGFMLYNLGAYPAAVPTNDINKKLVGEVWEISVDVLNNLDWLEGYPSFYDRTLVGTVHGEAWIYYKHYVNDPECPEIPSGNWREHLGR